MNDISTTTVTTSNKLLKIRLILILILPLVIKCSDNIDYHQDCGIIQVGNFKNYSSDIVEDGIVQDGWKWGEPRYDVKVQKPTSHIYINYTSYPLSIYNIKVKG